MKKHNFFEALDVDSGLTKKAEIIEREIKELEIKRPGLQKQSDALGEKLWAAFEAHRKATVIGDTSEVVEKAEILSKLQQERTSPLLSNIREIENAKSKLSTLILPLKYAAREMIDRELSNLSKLYVCESTVARTNESGRLLSNTQRDIETGQAYIDILSNGWGLQEMKGSLTISIGLVMQAWSFSGFRKILDDLSKNLNSVDLTPKKETIKIEDFERINKPASFDLGFFVGNTIKKFNPNSRAERDFAPGSRIQSGRNPW